MQISHTINDKTIYVQVNYENTYYDINIENNIIVKAFENSLIVFDGKLKHGIVNMPESLAKNNYRYSIVIDYNYA